MEHNKTVGDSKPSPQSGYDLPLYGLADGTFYYVHIPAILCIVASCTCAMTSIILSFRRKSWRTFFKSWSKSEKFVVYLAICDGMFNICHFMDHTHIVVTKSMVYPKELCEFYGFNLAVFICAQNLMVNVIAVNAFMLIFLARNLNFGRMDWKLLTWTFGAPFVGTAIAGIGGQLGPTSAYCYFDAIKGKVAHIFFTSVPLILVFVINVILYMLTWIQITRQTRDIKRSLGTVSESRNASHRAVRAMSLFVGVFFVQWCPLTVFGIWNLIDEGGAPHYFVYVVVTVSNIGGVLNLIVFLILRRGQSFKSEESKDTEMTATHSSKT